MPRETMARLLDLKIPTQFIYGNGDLAILAQLQATNPGDVTYWGTSGDAPMPEPFRETMRWTARQIAEYRDTLARWPLTVTLEIDGLGTVLFCHATPRNETEIFTRVTPEERLAPVFAGVEASVVVCGHTHMQFDRMVGPLRVINAGSVGMPFATTGADWLLLGTWNRVAEDSIRPECSGRPASPHGVSDGRGHGRPLHPQPTIGAGTLRRVGANGGVMRRVRCSVRLQPDLTR